MKKFKFNSILATTLLAATIGGCSSKDNTISQSTPVPAATAIDIDSNSQATPVPTPELTPAPTPVDVDGNDSDELTQSSSKISNFDKKAMVSLVDSFFENRPILAKIDYNKETIEKTLKKYNLNDFIHNNDAVGLFIEYYNNSQKNNNLNNIDKKYNTIFSYDDTLGVDFTNGNSFYHMDCSGEDNEINIFQFTNSKNKSFSKMYNIRKEDDEYTITENYLLEYNDGDYQVWLGATYTLNKEDIELGMHNNCEISGGSVIINNHNVKELDSSSYELYADALYDAYINDINKKEFKRNINDIVSRKPNYAKPKQYTKNSASK